MVTLYPAIDLRGGRAVRLQQGRPDRESIYAEDPVGVAHRFAEAGAEWIHVVDLDAAFGTGSNRALVAEIAAATPLRIQTGGGLRSLADLEAVFAAGVARAVIGTAAVENPELVGDAAERWGGARIAVGLDARGTRPATRGWTEDSGRDLFELAATLVDRGVRTLIYTDIERDGMFAGPNLEVSAELARRTSAEVIVSGGIGALEHLAAIAGIAAAGPAAVGIGGVIVGRALYEERFGVADALRALSV